MGSQYGNQDRTNDSAVYGTISVSTTATELKVGGSILDGRDFLIIQPKENSIYLGFDNSVTSSTGIELKKNQTMQIAAGDNISVYAIASSGTIDVRIGELA